MSGRLFEEAPRRGLNARQAETVEKLLAAGLEELREVGHEALTVRTVAQRAGVSPATAYTYLSSKNHLFAELFWRRLADKDQVVLDDPDVAVRLRATISALANRIVGEPELAAAVTPALLGSDPDVERLRLRIGGEFVRRFETALAQDGKPADRAVLDVLVLSWSGALLQAGMGIVEYADLADTLGSVVEVVLRS